MQWHWVAITLVALYFTGHLLHSWGLLWAALVWLGLSLAVALMFGACVALGREE